MKESKTTCRCGGLVPSEESLEIEGLSLRARLDLEGLSIEVGLELHHMRRKI